MRRKFKVKKKLILRKKIKLFILLIIFVIVLYLFCDLQLKSSQKIIIDNIFKINNNYSYIEEKNTNIIYKLYNYTKEKIFNTPSNLLKSQLKHNFIKKEEVSLSYIERKDPIIYIYNSHQGETYSMEYLEAHNIVPDVLMASNILKDKLNNIGIESLVEEKDILNYMKENNLNHAGSYKASRHFLQQAINNYPSVELFIDLHRDAANHKVSTTTINEKECAKVLFVIGLENKTYNKNLAVVTKLNNIILNKYPTLTRGIMKKEGAGVNGIYNQDLSGNVILIEIGGHENNIEEVNNTLDLIAQVIGEYLNEEKKGI